MRIFFVDDQVAPPVKPSEQGSATAHAVAVASYLKKGGTEATILTGDDGTSATALSHGVGVVRINPTIYTGRRKLVLPIKAYAPWFSQGSLSIEDFKGFFPEEPALLLNEFVEFIVDPDRATCQDFKQYIGRFEPTIEQNEPPRLRMLHYVNDLPSALRPRNAGQAMFAEALLAPCEEIPIVICPSVFGTGKTYLATGIGYMLVNEKRPRYDQIFVVPRDSDLGRQIGYLPGSESEKTLPKAMPIIDNLRKFLQNDAKGSPSSKPHRQVSQELKNALDDNFTFTSVVNMGGRSISDSWIIYDEAQDLERFQINQLMKRIGDCSKMVVMGDPHQVFNRHMNETSNGLSYAATKMAGSPYAVVVTMTEGEITRSLAAREIARRLDH